MPPIIEDEFEKCIELFETEANEALDSFMKINCQNGEKSGQVDENAVCDVCRSPVAFDDNQILFCDGCEVAVHQAC